MTGEDKKAGLVPVTEAAELMSVSVSTVRRLVAGRELKAKRIGRIILIRLDSIDQYLKRL